MNEAQINAQFAALVEQRNNALNQVVNMAGELAVVKAELEAAKALIETKAEDLDDGISR